MHHNIERKWSKKANKNTAYNITLDHMKEDLQLCPTTPTQWKYMKNDKAARMTTKCDCEYNI
eukprot:TRINITY_DN5340_c0_g1_i1.p3 TRINITY_DN5340_c0_g1~~TRINITY_DN5340_c0_g1_i1.p3  ORF type:complete len:62 (+),score=7.87 TRINITY_DN5340_c0_g1_i1:99-284(+)